MKGKITYYMYRSERQFTDDNVIDFIYNLFNSVYGEKYSFILFIFWIFSPNLSDQKAWLWNWSFMYKKVVTKDLVRFSEALVVNYSTYLKSFIVQLIWNAASREEQEDCCSCCGSNTCSYHNNYKGKYLQKYVVNVKPSSVLVFFSLLTFEEPFHFTFKKRSNEMSIGIFKKIAATWQKYGLF